MEKNNTIGESRLFFRVTATFCEEMCNRLGAGVEPYSFGVIGKSLIVGAMHERVSLANGAVGAVSETIEKTLAIVDSIERGETKLLLGVVNRYLDTYVPESLGEGAVDCEQVRQSIQLLAISAGKTLKMALINPSELDLALVRLFFAMVAFLKEEGNSYNSLREMIRTLALEEMHGQAES